MIILLKVKYDFKVRIIVFSFFFLFRDTKSGPEKMSTVGRKTTRPRSIVLPNYSKRHEDGSLMFQLIEAFTSNNINIPCLKEV